jgi:hypothetical protein
MKSIDSVSLLFVSMALIVGRKAAKIQFTLLTYWMDGDTIGTRTTTNPSFVDCDTVMIVYLVYILPSDFFMTPYSSTPVLSSVYIKISLQVSFTLHNIIIIY